MMILYHCASVASLSPIYYYYIDIITNKINFISRSFLLLTGLICGLHYGPKLYKESIIVKKRIATRGLKLLSIFIFGNIILYIFMKYDNYNVICNYKLISNLNIYHLIFMPGNLYSFSILYFLGFFLLIISPLINHDKILVFIVLILSFFNNNINILLAISYGITGLLIGKVFYMLHNNNKNSYFWYYSLFFFFIFLLIYYFTFTFFSKFNIILFDILSNLIIIILWVFIPSYLIMVINNNMLIANISLMGKYTLILYLFQILIIRIIFLMFANYPYFPFFYILNILLSLFILYIFVYILHNVRNKYPNGLINKIYNFIFN